MALRCEESDHYARVIALLNPQWRVIACADGIQWILQIRRGQGWRNRYFFRSRVGLISGCREYAGDIGGDALVILLQLPRLSGGGAMTEQFETRSKKVRGMAQRSLDLIEAMHMMRRNPPIRLQAGALATSCSPPG